MAVVGIEVEVVDNTQCQGGGVNGSGGNRGSVPVLKLRVDFDRNVVGNVVVQANTRGVDEGVGGNVASVAEDETWVMVVDFTAAKKEIDVGMKPPDGILDLGAEEEVFLAADVAFIDGIGPSHLKGWPEGAKREEGKVGTGGDSEIFAAFKVGESASCGAKG